jgi:hypothetical protein
MEEMMSFVLPPPPPEKQMEIVAQKNAKEVEG